MKRSQRTLQERFSIIRAYQDIEKEKGAKTKIVKSFNLPSISCLNAILSKSDDITKAYECNAPSKRLKLRYGSHPKLDQALYDWFLSMRSNNVSWRETHAGHNWKVQNSERIQQFKDSFRLLFVKQCLDDINPVRKSSEKIRSLNGGSKQKGSVISRQLLGTSENQVEQCYTMLFPSKCYCKMSASRHGDNRSFQTPL